MDLEVAGCDNLENFARVFAEHPREAEWLENGGEWHVSRLKQQPLAQERGPCGVSVTEPKRYLRDQLAMRPVPRAEALPLSEEMLTVRVLAVTITPAHVRALRDDGPDENWASLRCPFVGVVAAGEAAGRVVSGCSIGVWQAFAVVDATECQGLPQDNLYPLTKHLPGRRCVHVSTAEEMAEQLSTLEEEQEQLSPEQTGVTVCWRSPLSRRLCVEDVSRDAYLVTGGWGGLGLTTARFLVQEGARTLYLVSRRGRAVEESAATVFLRAAERSGVRVVGVAADLAEREGVVRVLDRVAMDGTHIDATYLPKAASALWFEKELEARSGWDQKLEHFVLFSSVTSLVGNYSQVNYGAANSVLDCIASSRHARGLAGLSIQWGPWTEQGMAAELVGIMEKVGMRGLSNDAGLRVLHAAMFESTHAEFGGAIGAQAFVWKRFLRRYTNMPRFYGALPSTLLNSGEAGDVIDLSKLTHEELVGLLADIAQQVSGTSERPDADTAMIDMGFDSLGAVEFRNNVLDTTGVRLPQTLAFENPSLGTLADHIFAAAGASAAATSASKSELHGKATHEWLLQVFGVEAERATLYIEPFANHFPTLGDLIGVEDVDTALRTVIQVADERDRGTLAIAWNELQDKALGQAGQTVSAGAVKRTGAKVPHPLEDLAMLKDELVNEGGFMHFDVKKLQPMTPVRDTKRVLLTGVTGFVGRCQIAALLKLSRERDMGLTVFCIVRARSVEHGMERIREACVEAVVWEDWFADHIEVLPGDFTKTDLGVGGEKFDWLCRNIDLVYHTGGDVNLLCNYSKVRETNTLSVRGIVKLCTTHKVKSLNFTSTLGQYPDLFGFFTNEFADRFLHEDTGPRLDEMEKYFPPQRQGYPWSKWAAEMVIREARSMGLPAHIYRLPNMYCGYRTGYTNRTDYATALMISTIQEGCFPISSAFAVLTPVDIIADMVVEGGLLLEPETRQHWVYNLIDTALVYMKDMEEWAARAGVQYRGVDLDTFLQRVKKRGPSSPVHRFVPLMQYWRQYWFSQTPRETPWPIRTQNVFDDLPHQKWPKQEDVFRASFLYCAARNYFPADSLSVSIDTDKIIEAAEKQTGLDDPGDDFGLMLEPVLKPFSDELTESKISIGGGANMSFIGKLSLFRTSKQYLINMLVMTDKEKLYPVIRQQVIRRPLVITGLNRSGTTFLQNLLCQDKKNRGVLYLEQVALYGENGEFDQHGLPDDYDIRSDPRGRYAQDLLDAQLGMTDEWMLIHAQDAYKPEEEFLIMEHSGRSYSICVEFAVKSYRNWLLGLDQPETDRFKELKVGYDFHHRFLQHLQWQRRGGDRFLLKMPFHLFALDALFDKYPDAQVVMTHRDPVEVMGSWCSLVTHARERTSNNVDPKEIGAVELRDMSTMIDCGIQYRKAHPERANQFTDVQFHELISNPIETVKKIYEKFQLPLEQTTVDAMTEFINTDRAQKKQRHHYTLDNAGLNEEKVRGAFKNYYDSGFLTLRP
ncbi:putative type I fatty acid synthase [Gregarina niphandrodes]|uniref:Type I fatty acid synthase n=1 Tax=Gregarina niphandrodes TaxID=110365 RepID=A0A023B098_GRENI|nr:putative type I fatty acid synthase [Gregarina niphandrodes]EZG44549.1 putative type I fatty acid synthase [Gregarina niphandrodes]|eukprot:XP_011134163.1 putative type I fatty acid synthase [Gregarina niphandrodes]